MNNEPQEHKHIWKISSIPYAHAWCTVWMCTAEISDEELENILNGKLQVSDFDNYKKNAARDLIGGE